MVFFISGHRDISLTEFGKFYKSAIDKAVENFENCKFVVGDYSNKRLYKDNIVNLYKPYNFLQN
ncbi:MAG: hypothetical protein [Wendovervirus sonii]|uniref:Uncharacterized protein n=1 Tax=phage Lak_Megaphage_Sonny TaxID=3109229 RepID=A0ABZ0Z494_9CAUD|nr:MAG: hypothetical protein [phage Lak_Megaphage_Sonny]